MSGLAALSDFGHEECLTSSLPLSAGVSRPDCQSPQAAATPQPEELLSNHHILPSPNLPGFILSMHVSLKLTARINQLA